MTYCKAFALALNALLLRSNAFVVPTRRARAIGIYQSLKLERNDKLGTSVDKKSKFQIWERLPDQRYDPSPTSSLQQQLENFLAPVSDYLDNASDGWALSYADLTPNSERTVTGQLFLATNIAYTIVGAVLSLQGEVVLGIFSEICSVASFIYHYNQLQQPYGRTKDSTVRLALLVDYFFAITAILIGLFYLVVDHAIPPPEGIAIALLGIVCLLSCWVWEEGLPYIILHGLWHLFSAATAYYIGVAHAAS